MTDRHLANDRVIEAHTIGARHALTLALNEVISVRAPPEKITAVSDAIDALIRAHVTALRVSEDSK